MVVDEDDINIGAGGEFAAAELAHAQDYGTAAGHLAMRLFHAVEHGVEGCGNDQVSQIGEGLARARA